MKRILSIVGILFCFFDATASHVKGGEITWECLGASAGANAGKYMVRMNTSSVNFESDARELPSTGYTIALRSHFKAAAMAARELLEVGSASERRRRCSRRTWVNEAPFRRFVSGDITSISL